VKDSKKKNTKKGERFSNLVFIVFITLTGRTDPVRLSQLVGSTDLVFLTCQC